MRKMMRLLRQTWILNRIYSLINIVLYRLKGVRVSWLTYLDIDSSSRVVFGKGCKISGPLFRVGANSTLAIGDNSAISGFFSVGQDNTVQIGKRFRVMAGGSFSIDKNSQVVVGDYCLISVIAPHAGVIQMPSGRITIGENVTIRAKVIVDDGDLTIGSHTFINQGSELRCMDSVSIGSYVLVSYYVDIFDTNTHSLDAHSRRQEIDQGFPNTAIQDENYWSETAPILIGDDVWIGKYAAILKGCFIGDRSIVGTRAVVTQSCPEDSLVVGNPARIRPLASGDQHE